MANVLLANVYRANHVFMFDGRELWTRVPMGDEGVKIDAPLGGVRMFSHEYKGTRLLFLDVAEASDDESGFDIASVALDEARVDTLIAALTAWRNAGRATVFHDDGSRCEAPTAPAPGDDCPVCGDEPAMSAPTPAGEGTSP
jgi:hypothetical protein